MKKLKHPITLYYVAPTGRETKFTTIWYYDKQSDTAWSEDKAFLIPDLKAIKAGARPWLRLEGELPE